MKNLDPQFVLHSTFFLKNKSDNNLLFLLGQQILNSKNLPLDLQNTNLALSGAFYYCKLNKAIGINYIPQAFIDRIIGEEEKNTITMAWNSGFMYASNRKLGAANIQYLESLSNTPYKENNKKIKLD